MMLARLFGLVGLTIAGMILASAPAARAQQLNATEFVGTTWTGNYTGSFTRPGQHIANPVGGSYTITFTGYDATLNKLSYQGQRSMPGGMSDFSGTATIFGGEISLDGLNARLRPQGSTMTGAWTVGNASGTYSLRKAN